MLILCWLRYKDDLLDGWRAALEQVRREAR